MLKDIARFLGWNWEGLSFVFPAYILLEIKATPLPFSSQGWDRLSWFSSPNDIFKFKEAYCLANWEDNSESDQSFRGDWVWRVQSLSKIKCFLWQCCHHSIPVHAILSKRGMDIPFLCPMCNNAFETIIHTLRDCPTAQCFWNSLNPPPPSKGACFMVLTWWIGWIWIAKVPSPVLIRALIGAFSFLLCLGVFG